MIWEKVSPFTHKTRYIPDFEYMFVLTKGTPKTANLICDRKNIYAGTQIHGNQRNLGGDKHDRSDTQKSKQVKEYGARYNIWHITPDRQNDTGHPAVFPVQLAKDHIITWSNEGDTVLDCFMGSGSTGIACIETNRNFIGIEIDKQYFDGAKSRLDAVDSSFYCYKKPNMIDLLED